MGTFFCASAVAYWEFIRESTRSNNMCGRWEGHKFSEVCAKILYDKFCRYMLPFLLNESQFISEKEILSIYNLIFSAGPF